MRTVLYRLDTGLPFIADADEQINSDGSVSYWLPANAVLPVGGWGGQEPNAYGVRHDQPGNGAPRQYQRALRVGAIVTFLTRPGDAPMSYLVGQGQVFPG